MLEAVHTTSRTAPPRHGLTGPRIYRNVEVPNVARCYDELVLQLIARRHELGITQAELDGMVGWADGYAGKVEAPPEWKDRRRPNSLVFADWLQALDVVLVVMPLQDNEATDTLTRAKRRRGALMDVAFAALRRLGLGVRVVPRECMSRRLPSFKFGSEARETV